MNANVAVNMHEETRLLPGHAGEPRLFVRHRPGRRSSVIYVHGATFPSALSVAYRFNGRSWMDDLAERGFDAWGFDFAGFGHSDRPAIFDHAPQGVEPYGRVAAAAEQLAHVVDHVAAQTGKSRVSLLAHSWGSMVAGRYASHHPERVDRLAFFGPIGPRMLQGLPEANSLGAWQLMTTAAQLKRFIEDVPTDHPPVLIEPELAEWAPAYLATDKNSATYPSGPAVKIPTGPQADILAAWSGGFPYDPEKITAPVLVVRGAWDSLMKDADAATLLGRFSSRDKRDVKVSKGTHLMHLEHSREGLFAAAGQFLDE
jgi:pimeloyl-ACP methyl ester carboxylesterase